MDFAPCQSALRRRNRMVGRARLATLAVGIEPLEQRFLLTSVVVNTTTDVTHSTGSAVVSLRDAINIADKSTTATSITFSPTVFAAAKTITLTNGNLAIGGTRAVNISGTFAGVTVSGGGKSGVLVIEKGATATVSWLTITGGSNTGNGGGIDNAGTLTLTRCTVAGNSTPIVVDSFTPVNGGGIENEAGAALTVVDSTIADNSVGGNQVSRGGFSPGAGGGIDNNGALTVTNSTISRNSTSASGGGGIDNESGATLAIANSIVAGNGTDVAGSVKSLGFNLIGQNNGSTGWKSTDLTGAATHPLNALMSPLASFGGPTATFVPLAGSPAIDHGSNALIPAGITTDQRGLPRIANHTVDIGAVEVQPTSAHIAVAAKAGLKAVEGLSASLSAGSFTESGATGPYLIQVNWGDGTSGDALKASAPGALPADAHTFADEGVYHGTLSAIDAQGHSSGQTPFTVNVADAPLSGFGKPRSGVAAGVPFAWQVAYFSDANPNSTASDFTAKINWGDGTTSAGVVASTNIWEDTGPYGVTGTHTYLKPGTYKFTVTVVDAGGANVSVSSTVTCTTSKTIVVNTTNDQIDPSGSATISLRDAVAAADKSTVPISISFDPKVFASAETITLKGSELELSSPTTISIVGPTAGVTISGNGKSTVFAVDRGVTASLSGLTITRGEPGISNAGVLFLTNSSVVANTGAFGGGISNNAFMVLTGDTVSNNLSSGAGGGIENDGKMTLIDCTISGNNGYYGGGIGNGLNSFGVLTLFDSTIWGNTASFGGGIDSNQGPAGGTVTIGNSIVAGNTATYGADVLNVFDSLGFNLIGQTDSSTGWIASDRTGTTAKPLNPNLGPLANNGGPTQTLLPKSGSPAINHGSNALIPQGLTNDQRGMPRIMGGIVDIGAVEV